MVENERKAIDVNLKAYKTLDFGKYLVGYPIEALMVPNSCKAVQFLNKTAIHHANVGVNFDKFMFAYTYSQLSGAVYNGGYHQIP
jgi:hypothetical protein